MRQIMVHKVCDIEGCNDEATEIITVESEDKNNDEFFQVAMCSFHYRDYRSDEGLGKPFNLKGVVVQHRYN
jgi:hypothetical protein